MIFTLIGLTPFEKPDVDLVLALQHNEVFPILHLGHVENDGIAALEQVYGRSTKPFGICVADNFKNDIRLTTQVTHVVLHPTIDAKPFKGKKILYQVTSSEDALKVLKKQPAGLIIKGNESAGVVGEKSSLILFQEIKKITKIPLWVQGGMGIHSSAAVIACGAAGVIIDSQLALFPETDIPLSTKELFKSLDGTETRVIDNYRILVRPNSPALPADAKFDDIIPWLNGKLDIEGSYIPVGQDISFAYGFAKQYKVLKYFIAALEESIQGHLRQAKAYQPICSNNRLADYLGLQYPIAQGPMTRVSDVPDFAQAVAENGALPFIALALLKGDSAKNLLSQTKAKLAGKAWGVGILGFVSSELRKEQLQYIEEIKPPVVLIAGGRPSQAKALEDIGIKTFLHVPTPGLLDIFLKEGARNFVFEGHECGGHVGPLSSLVLWEKQIDRLLEEDEPENLNIFFAGGVHDALSAAIVSVMAAPLVAKGVKVGVLIGTAYLYTKEIITSGALVKGFQEQAIKQNATVLVESGVGHTTRCLSTPFVKFFEKEKIDLMSSGLGKKEILERLEQLNVGRLRIATKGISRDGDNTVTHDVTQQLSQGMYMIGQVAALRNKVITIQDLHKDVTSASEIFSDIDPVEVNKTENQSLDIAIIGMACIYPGASDVNEYWRNIVLGKDSITEVPDERWNKEIYYDPNASNGEKSVSKWGGFIPTVQFDPVEFGIPPQSVAAIDPTQLLSLKVAKEALRDAGYDKREFDRENTSVIFGVDGGASHLSLHYNLRSIYPQIFGQLPDELDKVLPRLTEDSFPGTLPNVVAGRIANRLDLGGSNYGIDAACASSLAAIDVACQELVLGKSSMVLAGGADLHNNITDYLLFSSTKALSKKGKCQTFDAEADGIALGEGIAVVVLKRLKDAKQDNDRIYAVLKGVGSASDGKSLGLTAPRKQGQVRALERAYRQAGISASEVGLMEAHGTGTVVGDKTELSSMTDLLIRSGALKNQTQLGSVKTQIGHTKCASGLAGLIKASLSVYHGVKPPTINLKQPNKFYNQDISPFVFNKTSAMWSQTRRVAGISAFGFGGTNFHAVIESNSEVVNEHSIITAWPAELCVFRGNTWEEASLLLQQVKTLLRLTVPPKLKDIAYTLAVANSLPVQISIVAKDTSDLLEKIESVLKESFSKGIFRLNEIKGKVAFMFSGQGSQRVNMARELFVIFPSMRKLLTSQYEKLIFPDSVFDEVAERSQADLIKDTRIAQPLLGIVDYAIASFLEDLGIHPDMVAGHSYGELPALCFANVFDEHHLIELSEKRASSILGAMGDDKGAMLAVSCHEQELIELLMDFQELYLANHNSPSQLVVSGTTKAIQQLALKLKSLDKPCQLLPVACAFHSPLLSHAQEYFYSALKAMEIKPPTIPVWSNTSATVYPTTPEEIKKRMAEHLVKPVLFCEEVKEMYNDGARVFIEVGPGKVLTQLVTNILGKDCVPLHTEQKGVGGIEQLLTMLAQFTTTGRTIRIENLFSGRKCNLIDLASSNAYKLGITTWNVNGQIAMPIHGNLPSHGAMPIVQPIQIKQLENTVMSNSTDRANIDTLILEYLKNVNTMVQAQRDVLLSYMGKAAPATNLPNISGDSDHAINMLKTSSHSIIEAPHTEVKSLKFSKKDLELTVLQIVSDKTGYPMEMLGLDMDMEADLSIDSIKRVEIIGSLRIKLKPFLKQGKYEDAMEQLTSLKTLNGLIGWLNNQIDEHTIPSQENLNVSSANDTQAMFPGRETNVLAEISRDTIKNLLLEIVSEKTGYPQEMLGMDMDMEADLSIDSIKRVEIIGVIKSTLKTFARTWDNSDEFMEKLASLKTLSGLVNWLFDSVSHQPGSFLDSSLEQVQVNEESENELLRLTQDLVRSKPDLQSTSVLEGKMFGIIGAETLTDGVASQLRLLKAQVNVVSPTDDLENYHGLIIIDTASPTITIEQVFHLVKKLNPKKVKWILLITDFKNTIENSHDLTCLYRIQGFTGFLNSLDKEWDAKCRTIHIEQGLTAEEIAAIGIDELLAEDPSTCVYYKENERYVMALTDRELLQNGKPIIDLKKEDVVLVLGGAQGITADIVIRLSQQYPCHYILVGRSPDPLPLPSDVATSLLTHDEIRKQLLREHTFKSPRALEEKVNDVYKRNQILNTIQHIENNKARATYVSADVKDKYVMMRLLDDIYRKYGRIDGVVHATGIVEDKLFISKSYESFERVYATKVNPLKVLVEKLKEDVKFIILFSSISSVMGSKGQVDYATANDVLDEYAWALSKKIKRQVKAVNWGPWKGKGMVSPELENDFRRRGILTIPLAKGADAFIRELNYGSESQVVIMSPINVPVQ